MAKQSTYGLVGKLLRSITIHNPDTVINNYNSQTKNPSDNRSVHPSTLLGFGHHCSSDLLEVVASSGIAGRMVRRTELGPAASANGILYSIDRDSSSDIQNAL